MCASRMIIGSVTHTSFSVLDDLHLSLPFIFGIIIFPLGKLFISTYKPHFIIELGKFGLIGLGSIDLLLLETLIDVGLKLHHS